MSPMPLGILAASGVGGGDFELVSYTRLTSNASTISLNSNGAWAGYKDIRLMYGVRSTYTSQQNDFMYMRHNNGTSGYYNSWTYENNFYSRAATNSVQYDLRYIHNFNYGNLLPTSYAILDFPDANSSDSFVTFQGQIGGYQPHDTAYNVMRIAGANKNQNTLSSIQLFLNNGNFGTNSWFAIYGVK